MSSPVDDSLIPAGLGPATGDIPPLAGPELSAAAGSAGRSATTGS